MFQTLTQSFLRMLTIGHAVIRFNLGISCINLRVCTLAFSVEYVQLNTGCQRYKEAAHHILDALVLQDSDGVVSADSSDDKRGVTSSVLWDSLKTCSTHLQRLDLAALCDRQDLEGAH